MICANCSQPATHTHSRLHFSYCSWNCCAILTDNYYKQADQTNHFASLPEKGRERPTKFNGKSID